VSLAPSVAVKNITRLMRWGAARGVEVSAMERLTGISMNVEKRHDARLSGDVLMRLFEFLGGQLGRDVGFRYGSSTWLDHLGEPELMILTAENLRHALKLIANAAPLWTYISDFEVIEGPNRTQLRWIRPERDSLGLRMHIESSLSIVLHTVLQSMTGRDLWPIAVHIRHDDPGISPVPRQLMGVEPHWNADHDELIVPTEFLATPMEKSDTRLHEFFQEQVKELIQLIEAHEPLPNRVANGIREHLHDGAPKIEVVARGLAMSARTLQRRLADAGLSFRDLVAEARADDAKKRLSQSDEPIGSIAIDLGFSEPAAFTRAFKRQVGVTPASFRAKARKNRPGPKHDA